MPQWIFMNLRSGLNEYKFITKEQFSEMALMKAVLVFLKYTTLAANGIYVGQ